MNAVPNRNAVGGLDPGVSLASLILILFGVVMSYSATAALDLESKLPPLFFDHVTGLVAGLALAACGGVDREGTRDNIVEQLADAGVEIDADCVDAALDKYSDDELESIDKTLSDGESSAEADALLQELFTCVPAGG